MPGMWCHWRRQLKHAARTVKSCLAQQRIPLSSWRPRETRWLRMHLQRNRASFSGWAPFLLGARAQGDQEIQPELRKVANTAREAAGLQLLLQEEAPDINSSDASGFAASKSTSESLSAWLARAKSQLKAYNAALAAIGDTPHEEMTAYVTIWPQVQEAAQNIQKRQQEFRLRLVQTSRNRAHTAVTTLQQSVAGLNWKARLAEGEASWSAIVKEIEYTFWKAKESPIHAMEAQYAQATEAMEAYTDERTNNAVAAEKALNDLWTETKKATAILNTEEYFCRIIEESGDSTQRKLSRRQTQILGLFKYESIHVAIRERVKQVTGI